MRGIRRTLRGPSLLPKTQRNHAFLIWTRFKTLWRSEIHINLKIDADALNRRRSRFCVRRKIYRIYQGQRWEYAGKCACVHGVCSVKNKIENETNLTDCTANLTQPNPTQPNLNSPNSFQLHRRLYYRKHNGISQFYYEHVSQRCGGATSIPI
jgi:hypothetical protein